MEKVEGEVEVDEARSTRPRRRHHAVDHTTSEADVNSKSSNNPQQSENEFGQKTAIGDAQSNFAATLSTFVEKASQPDYQFDSFSGLYFDNKNDVFYDPQTAVYFNPENGSCFIWNTASSSWEDFTPQYGSYYGEIWKSSWGGYIEQQMMQQLEAEDEARKQAFEQATTDPKKGELKEIPSMMRLIQIDALTIKDIPGGASYDVGKFADETAANTKRQKLSDTNQGDVNEDARKFRKVFTVGRSSINSIQIPDEQVSTKHAEIVWECVHFVNAFLVKDLGSANGTFLNEERITEAREVNAEPIPLEDGDMIRFGANAAYRVEFLVDYDTEAQFLSEIQAIHSETEAQKRRKDDFERERLRQAELSLHKLDPKIANRELRKELLGSTYAPSRSSRPSPAVTTANTYPQITQPYQSPYQSQYDVQGGGGGRRSGVFDVDEKSDFDRLLAMSTSAGTAPKLLGSAPERPLGGPSDDGTVPIPETNIGHRLLMKMGWKWGQAVGTKGEGITEPVKANGNRGFSGLGFRR